MSAVSRHQCICGRPCVRCPSVIMSACVCVHYMPLSVNANNADKQDKKAKPSQPEETLHPWCIPSLNYACCFVVARNVSHSDYVKTFFSLKLSYCARQTERGTPFLHHKCLVFMCVLGVSRKSGLPDKIWDGLCCNVFGIWQERTKHCHHIFHLSSEVKGNSKWCYELLMYLQYDSLSMYSKNSAL